MNHELRKHCDALASEFSELIQPELRIHGRSGPYVVLVSEMGVPSHGDWFGLAASTMGLRLRSEIPNWRGNGPAVLVNDSAILESCGGCYGTACGITTAVACHEIAHVLQFPRLCADEMLGDWEPRAFKRVLAEPSPVTPAEEIRERPQHDRQFIRWALHVRRRMQRRGWRVPLNDLMQWDRFAYVAAEWHVESLRDDFEKYEALPLSVIPFAPEPPDFTRLFDANLESFSGFMSLFRSF